MFNRAVGAGATATMPPMDMFWGDRMASVTDPFGQAWSFATHLKDLSPAEIAKGGEEFFAKMAQGAHGAPGPQASAPPPAQPLPANPSKPPPPSGAM
jgi:hypothetical protein